MKSTFYVEYYGKQIDQAALIKEAKSIWTKSGKKAVIDAEAKDNTGVGMKQKPVEVNEWVQKDGNHLCNMPVIRKQRISHLQPPAQRDIKVLIC